jgi:hypothetical protein
VELAQIEERRQELTALIASADSDAPLPTLHPHMAEVFRECRSLWTSRPTFVASWPTQTQ